MNGLHQGGPLHFSIIYGTREMRITGGVSGGSPAHETLLWGPTYLPSNSHARRVWLGVIPHRRTDFKGVKGVRKSRIRETERSRSAEGGDFYPLPRYRTGFQGVCRTV